MPTTGCSHPECEDNQAYRDYMHGERQPSWSITVGLAAVAAFIFVALYLFGAARAGADTPTTPPLPPLPTQVVNGDGTRMNCTFDYTSCWPTDAR